MPPGSAFAGATRGFATSGGSERPQGGQGPAASEAGAGAAEGAPVVIKKYANRRLYNTAASTYVTLEHLSEMVREGVDFIVLDAKSGDDITRSVLAQIIFEQESRGQNLLPVAFLRRLIRFYGDQMQGFLPPYLDMSMESFSKAQEQMRENILAHVRRGHADGGVRGANPAQHGDVPAGHDRLETLHTCDADHSWHAGCARRQ